MTVWDRIFRLNGILSTRRTPISTRSLMAELECSRATLNRALGFLRDRCGAPIRNSPGVGYFYDRSAGTFEMPGLWFAAEELEALLVMDRLLESAQPSLLRDRLAGLQANVRSILEDGLRDPRPFPVHRVRILRSHARRVSRGQLVHSASALVERRQMAFAYGGRTTDGISQRRVSPQRLVYYRDQWYFDGWDEDQAALRTFALDRMREIEVLDVAARSVPEAELDAALTAGYGLFSGAARHQARLRFSAERARWVADEVWHPEQENHRLADGRYELRVPYADPRELVGEILRHGAEVEVVEPAELIGMVREALEQAARQYGGE